MATVNANVLTNHTPITASFLRNGPAAQTSRTARASSIATRYHYRGVRFAVDLLGNAATRDAPCPVAVILDTQIRVAYSTITEGIIAERAQAAGPAAAQFDADAVRREVRADETFRHEAIGLGAVHASLVVSYHITEADLVGTESGPSLLTLTAPAAQADAAAFAAALSTPAAGWTVVVASGNVAGAMDHHETAAVDMAYLNLAEAELAFHLFALAQSSPVRAGSELFVSGHHYLSSNTARHVASEKEVFAQADVAAKQLWENRKPLFRNVVWHKGTHIIVERVLIGFATSAQVREALDVTGYGSFSVGLPAQEDILKRANAYLAVLAATRTTVLAHEHTVNMDKLQSTVTAFSALPIGGNLPAQAPAHAGEAAAAWANGVTTRAEALRVYVAPRCVIAEPVAAWLFGFYREMCDDASIREASPEGSLLRSYALKRAGQNHIGEMNNGMTSYQARKKFIKAEGAEGRLETRDFKA